VDAHSSVQNVYERMHEQQKDQRSNLMKQPYLQYSGMDVCECYLFDILPVTYS
jgi:hypothetical protein